MNKSTESSDYKSGYSDGLERGLAEGRLEERERVTQTITQWFAEGCPGLDRERFVAFGPLGMKDAIRDGILDLMESLRG